MHDVLQTPGLGESQTRLLEAIKRRGEATIPTLAEEVALNVETVRNHLRRMTAEKLVERKGHRRPGPGRPEIVYGLTARAEALFPRREPELLRELARHLVETGNHDLLDSFYAKYVSQRRTESLARVAHLTGRERLQEVARLLSEQGFMAVVEEAASGPVLRLCHCPVRALVDATRIPCQSEVALVRELLGERLSRISYIPSGDSACRYVSREPPA